MNNFIEKADGSNLDIIPNSTKFAHLSELPRHKKKRSKISCITYFTQK
jgi:hypothetical protein